MAAGMHVRYITLIILKSNQMLMKALLTVTNWHMGTGYRDSPPAPLQTQQSRFLYTVLVYFPYSRFTPFLHLRPLSLPMGQYREIYEWEMGIYGDVKFVELF